MSLAPNSSLEQRIGLIEDRLAIYNLIALHPPGADTGAGAFLPNFYTEDVVFDRGPDLGGAVGIANMVAFVESDEHKAAIDGGLAHLGNLPFIELQGDSAFVTSYVAILALDHEGKPRELSNHGVSTGYRIHRVLANRWTLVRTEDGWRVKVRKLFPLDGTPAARELLSGALATPGL